MTASDLQISNEELQMLETADPQLRAWVIDVIRCRNEYFGGTQAAQTAHRAEVVGLYDIRDRLFAENKRLRDQIDAQRSK